MRTSPPTLEGARPTVTHGGFFNDQRHILLAVVAAISTFDPGAATSYGPVVVVLCCLPDLLKFRPQAADGLAALFVVLMMASSSWSISPAATDVVASDQLMVVMIFIGLRVALVSRRAVGFVAAGYLIGCLWSLWLLLQANPTAALSLRFDERNAFTIYGVNANYIAYALAGGVGVAVIAGMLMKRGRWVVVPVIIAAAYAGIGLTGARGGFIAAVAVMAWLLVPVHLRRPGIVVIYAVAVGIAVGIFTGATDDLMRSRVPVASGGTGDLNGRLVLWPVARKVFDAHPWFGTGAGTFPKQNALDLYAHNVFLDVGAGVGTIGVALFVLLVWAALITGTRGTEPSARLLLIGTAICCLAPPLLSGYWYQAPATWVVLALFSRMAVIAPLSGGGRIEHQAPENVNLAASEVHAVKVTTTNASLV